MRCLVDLLEDVLGPPVVFLHDDVFGEHELRVVGDEETEVVRGWRIEELYAEVRGVHAHHEALALEITHVHRRRRGPIRGFEHLLQFPQPGSYFNDPTRVGTARKRKNTKEAAGCGRFLVANNDRVH